MKTAKEACEEAKQKKFRQFRNEIEKIIDYVIAYDGVYDTLYLHFRFLRDNPQAVLQLEELGYKVEKIYETVGLFFRTKYLKTITVSACCQTIDEVNK